MNSSLLAPSEATATARFFRVLADANRLKIVESLASSECTVSELVALLGVTQPRISTHLACLRHCGFVSTERRGKEIVYRLVLDGLDDVLKRAGESLAPVAERLATCTRIGPDWV
jgi:ArsR family transcriptional regulator, cadmium/lead-responsive transcriptional repressor